MARSLRFVAALVVGLVDAARLRSRERLTGRLADHIVNVTGGGGAPQ